MYSNAKNTIQLDGIFNIISYDVVPKLQQVLLASDFKVTAVNSIFNVVSIVSILGKCEGRYYDLKYLTIYELYINKYVEIGYGYSLSFYSGIAVTVSTYASRLTTSFDRL